MSERSERPVGGAELASEPASTGEGQGATAPAPEEGRVHLEHNVLGTFTDAEEAREAAIALERKGIEAANIEVRGAGMDGATAPVTNETQQAVDLASTGAIGKRSFTGVVIGVIVGTLLALGGSILYFNVVNDGDVVQAGILGAAFGGALAGAFLGGFIGGITGLPVNAETLDTFEAEVVSGGSTSVAVHSDEAHDIDKAVEALRAAGAARLAIYGPDGKLTDIR